MLTHFRVLGLVPAPLYNRTIPFKCLLSLQAFGFVVPVIPVSCIKLLDPYQGCVAFGYYLGPQNRD